MSTHTIHTVVFSFRKYLSTALAAVASFLPLLAQHEGLTSMEKVVSGYMVDEKKGDPIPFSNVYLRHTVIGTQTDDEGRFALSLPIKADTLWFNAMGYDDRYIVLSRSDRMDSLVVLMHPRDIDLAEVTVSPEASATRLMQSVRKNKKRNNPLTHQRVEYDKYLRWEYALSNISARTALNNPILKNAWSLMQMSEKDSSHYLTVYLSETMSHIDAQRTPRKVRATIMADRVKGINFFKEYEISGFSNAMDNEVDFYMNVVRILGVGFVSPIADDSFLYYDYFVSGSYKIAGPSANPTDSIKVFSLKFRPKNRGDKAFIGTMDIETRHYAPLRIDAEIPKWTNINFVKKIALHTTFTLVDDSIPFYETCTMDFTIDHVPVSSDKKRMAMRSSLYSTYSNVRFSISDSLALSIGALAMETTKEEGYKERDSAYWASHRPAEIKVLEQRSSDAIDAINNIGTVRAVNHIAKAVMTSHLDIGHVEVGPLGEMLNSNRIEGFHLGFGLRTSKEISDRWVVGGIVGYGFGNSRPTYGATLGYKFKHPLRRVVDLRYSDKITKIGEDENILLLHENMTSSSEANIVAQIFKRAEIEQLLYARRLSLRYDHEWTTGFSTRLQAFALNQESPKFYPFKQGGEMLRRVEQKEASIDFRISFREKFIDDGVQRIYMSTLYPIIHFIVAGGHTRAGDMRSRYVRLHSTVKQSFFLGQTRLNMAVENGIYFGRMPYSLLNIARGNMTYGYYRYDFNLMGYLDFVCDRYLYVHTDYSLGGLILHKLPLIYKLGLREVIGAKLMLGSLSGRQKQMLDLPEGLEGPTKPYVEISLGLDNILRFLRFDVVWRACGDARNEAPRLGVRGQLSFQL